jgi:glyoxylase-like metal-dependent hydrolase (beta-lactamase superfamily II)
VRIQAFETGTATIKENQFRGRGPGRTRILNALAGRKWTAPLPILCWLIEHDEGLILVDTGETARVANPDYFPRWHPYYRLATRFEVPRECEIGPLLIAAGVEPREISKVIITHMHTDHAGGLHHFENAEIILGAQELDAFNGPRAQLDGYLTHRTPTWLDPTRLDLNDGPFHGFDRSALITRAGDVRVVATPGHTPGHVSVVVDEGDKLVMLAGDTSYAQSTMLEGVVDGVSPKASVARRTMAAIRQTAKDRDLVYLPSHDPESKQRLADREPVPST